MKVTYINSNISPSNFGSIVISYNESNLKVCSNSDAYSGSIVAQFVCPDYSNALIDTLYDTQFSEFVEVSPTEQSSSIEPNETVESGSIEESNNPETISDTMMTRDTIIQLRIELGQGDESSQFSTEFPYERLS